MSRARLAMVLGLGARPFFVLAAAWAVVAVGVWPAVFAGTLALPGAFAPVDWHAHELIFGYGGAVVAGFLLTAIANWTGRPPVAGLRLGALVLAWLVARVVVAVLPPSPGLAVGLVFPLGLLGLAGWEILAAGNARNRKVIGILVLLVLADAGFTLAVAQGWDTGLAQRGGLAVLVLLILLIGGRVTPAFTRNWLQRNGMAAPVAAFDRLDAAGMGLAGLALPGWVGWPEARLTALPLALAGVVGLARLARWQGWAARRDLLLVVLHGGYGLAVLGFLAAAGHAGWPDWLPLAAVVHIWAVGAVGMTTAAMMTRATLGHTGQALRADGWMAGMYGGLLAALLARVGMALWPDNSAWLLWLAVGCWCAAFALFLGRFAPALLAGPRGPGGTRSPGRCFLCSYREAAILPMMAGCCERGAFDPVVHPVAAGAGQADPAGADCARLWADAARQGGCAAGGAYAGGAGRCAGADLGRAGGAAGQGAGGGR